VFCQCYVTLSCYNPASQGLAVCLLCARCFPRQGPRADVIPALTKLGICREKWTSPWAHTQQAFLLEGMRTRACSEDRSPPAWLKRPGKALDHHSAGGGRGVFRENRQACAKVQRVGGASEERGNPADAEDGNAGKG
jgi:hypothetical protein